jgi:hypothetical protein
MAGIATTLTSWNAGVARLTAPPRATFTRLERGATLGRPHDPVQQRCVLDATLELLAYDAPVRPVNLKKICA